MSELSDWIKHVHDPEVASLKKTIEVLRQKNEALMALKTASQNAWELLRYQPRDLPVETETAANLLEHALAALPAAGIETEG